MVDCVEYFEKSRNMTEFNSQLSIFINHCIVAPSKNVIVEWNFLNPDWYLDSKLFFCKNS